MGLARSFHLCHRHGTWGLLRDVGLETADYTLDSSWLVLRMQLSGVWKSGMHGSEEVLQRNLSDVRQVNPLFILRLMGKKKKLILTGLESAGDLSLPE